MDLKSFLIRSRVRNSESIIKVGQSLSMVHILWRHHQADISLRDSGISNDKNTIRILLIVEIRIFLILSSMIMQEGWYFFSKMESNCLHVPNEIRRVLILPHPSNVLLFRQDHFFIRVMGTLIFLDRGMQAKNMNVPSWASRRNEKSIFLFFHLKSPSKMQQSKYKRNSVQKPLHFSISMVDPRPHTSMEKKDIDNLKKFL